MTVYFRVGYNHRELGFAIVSTTVGLLAVAVAPDKAPASIRGLSDVEPFYEADGLFCYTMSRNGALWGWLQKTISGYSATDLNCLLLDGTILPPSLLEGVILAITAVLKSIEADPIDFLAKLGCKNPADYYYEPEASRLYDVEMVREELALPATLPHPEGSGEEGDSWAYMIGYLKSLREFFGKAKELGHCVLLGYSLTNHL